MSKPDLTYLNDVGIAIAKTAELADLLGKIQHYVDRTQLLRLQVRLRMERDRIDAEIQANAKSEGKPEDVPKLLQGTALPPPWIT